MMARPRVIYLEPGEMVEFRFVNEDDGYGRNAADWRAQSHPTSLLARLWPRRISAADFAVRFDHDFTNSARLATGDTNVR